jgi:nucleotide-binding universal stress UspA family protein
MLQNESEVRMRKLLERVPEQQKAKVKAVVRSGEAATAIVEHSLAHDAVVMGTHGSQGLEHFLLGSVAERVARHSDRPLLIVREGVKRFAPKRILVPTDFSNHARMALEHAALIAKVSDATIDVLHVVTHIPSLDGLEGFVVSFAGESAASYEAFALEHAQKELELFLEHTPGHDVAKFRVLHGDAVGTIEAVAEEGGYDMIVMGRRGHSLLGVELGGTALKILRGTRLPVWLLHDTTPIEALAED